MSELNHPLHELLNIYRREFQQINRKLTVCGQTPNDVKTGLPKLPGVYLIWHKGVCGTVIYIGCTGKLSRIAGTKLHTGGGTLNQRTTRWTPYFFDPTRQSFRYGPLKANNAAQRQIRLNDNAYAHSVPLSEITVECFTFNPIETKAPSVLEHILLQGYVNTTGTLPPANREL